MYIITTAKTKTVRLYLDEISVGILEKTTNCNGIKYMEILSATVE